MHIDLMRKREKAFPEIPAKESVTSLRVWHCKYATHSKLAELENLEELSIAGFPDKSFTMLVGLRRLRHLKVVNMPAVSDLSELGKISSLQSLSLATSPSWDSSGKVLTISSLEPLAQLPRLRHLELFGVVPKDRSLVALHGCKHLESLRVSRYPASEAEAFHASTGLKNSFNPPLSFEH